MAFCLRASNSAWVMAPLSSRALADAICSVGLGAATVWMYDSVALRYSTAATACLSAIDRPRMAR